MKREHLDKFGILVLFLGSWISEPTRDGLFSSFKLCRAEGVLKELIKAVEDESAVP